MTQFVYLADARKLAAIRRSGIKAQPIVAQLTEESTAYRLACIRPTQPRANACAGG